MKRFEESLVIAAANSDLMEIDIKSETEDVIICSSINELKESIGKYDIVIIEGNPDNLQALFDGGIYHIFLVKKDHVPTIPIIPQNPFCSSKILVTNQLFYTYLYKEFQKLKQK